jgi:hypothetical protein
MAAKVQPGMIIGVECASEQEPYVIIEARSAVYEYDGGDVYTWMEWIRAGDRLIDTTKFERYGDGYSFWSLTEKLFPIFEEDMRSILTEFKPVDVRQSKRVQLSLIKRIEIEKPEISNLEERVMMCLNSEPKKQARPRAK